MNLYGLDLGKGYTKIFDGKILKTFPSVVGHPERIKYQDDGLAPSPPSAGIHLTTAVGEYYVGDLALNQSSLSWTMMDRSDIADEMKLVLTLAALSELKTSGPLKLVTGVPVNWFPYKQQVIDLLQGEHSYTRGGKTYTVHIEEVSVVTEPHGTAFSETLDQTGKITNTALAGGLIGTIDIGMYTIDDLVLDKLGYVEPASGSLQTGMAHIYGMVARSIQNEFGIQDLELHQVDRLIRAGKITVAGEEHGLGHIVDPALQGLARKIVAHAVSFPSPLWKDGGLRLAAIFISGGGAHHLGAYLARTYGHAKILAGASTANVRGFYNAACYKWLPKPAIISQPTLHRRRRGQKSLNGAASNAH